MAAIEGLKVWVSGQHVRELCKKAAQTHKEKADAYRKRGELLASDDSAHTLTKSIDPEREIKTKIAQHENDAAELLFIADHVKESDEYLLDRGDLMKLGIARSHY